MKSIRLSELLGTGVVHIEPSMCGLYLRFGDGTDVWYSRESAGAGESAYTEDTWVALRDGKRHDLVVDVAHPQWSKRAMERP